MVFNRRSLIFFSFVFVLVVTASLLAGNGELVILHTNDIHGSFLPQRAEWIESHPLIGGFGPLSGALKQEQSANPSNLLLDAGDFMTGNPITTIRVHGAIGGAMLDFFELLHYQAMTIGNHEFDDGVDNAVDLVKASKVPIICANLWLVNPPTANNASETTTLLTGEGWKIFEVNGVRVGVIGLTLERMNNMLSKTTMKRIRVTPLAEEVQKVVSEIDPKTDLIVLLTHEGVDDDKDLAKHISGVDVIVGGHSHTVIDTPLVVNNVIIVQAGAQCRYLGELKLKVENDQVVQHSGRLIPLWADSLTPTLETQAMVTKYQEMLDKEFGKVLDTLDQDWKVSGRQESEVGDWLCDRLREYGHGDFAVINSGGIRKPLLKGPVTKMDIEEMLPFANRIVSFQCTGEQILTLVNTNTYAEVSKQYEIMQVSGLSYAIQKSTGKPTQIMVNGAPLNKKRTYRGISVDYVAVSQAHRYFGFTPTQTEDMGITFTDMIIQYMEAHGMKPKPVGERIRWIENK
jgi:5'-nucleotidase/UDP-sugar diphosphatase